MTAREAQSKREMADELLRIATAKREAIKRRSAPIVTTREAGEIGLLEYQADRLLEQAIGIERALSRRPWWVRLADVIGGRNGV